MTKQSFIHGTIILIIAGMITRLLGFVNRMVTARLMGEEGIGLYMLTMPTLFLLITLSQIGLPIAVAKRVAEASALGDMYRVKKILRLSLIIITCTSVFFMISLIIAAPFIARYLLTDERVLYPLLALSPAIPIIALASIIKGYFQGLQNMKPQSFALIIEQMIRIAAVFLFVTFLLPFGIVYAATGAVASIFIGELASIIYLVYRLKKEQQSITYDASTNDISAKKVRHDLFSIAIPFSGSKMIHSISTFIEPILVTQSLRVAGVVTSESTKQYGELTGFVMPILFLPTFITNSISIALVPSISVLHTKQNEKLLFARIDQAIRISFASGAIGTIIFTLFAPSILTYIYGTSNASTYLSLMAPFFLLLYVQTPLQSILIGLNYAKEVMWNNIIGSLVKFAVLILFTSQPQFGIYGVVIAINVYVLLVTLLHGALLYKKTNYLISFYQVCKMVLLVFIPFVCSYFLKIFFAPQLTTLIFFIVVIAIICVIYVLTMLILRFITKEEWQQLLNMYQSWIK
ncbi:MAG TPA: stage V sporulation protein B [Pseudogracilibacillus sp.]|nr:stage V sporulation protein B [Pseudogracilibacillus sp.]